jgi:2-aminoadipate transaminase
MPVEYRLSGLGQRVTRSLLRDMIGVVAQPDLISFAGGLPAPDVLPLKQLSECITTVLQRDGSQSLQYRPAHGPLLESVVELMRQRGVHVETSNVLITTGAQQALDVLAKLLLDGDSPVIFEQVAYTGIRHAFGWRTRAVRLVPSDPGAGIDVEAVEHVLATTRPAVIVVVPNYHNPLGATIPQEARLRLMAVAGRHDALVIEDDPYGPIYFDQPPPSPLKLLDTERVIFVGSFSKVIAPAMRLGWIAADSRLIEKLRIIKEAVDLESSALLQRVVAEFCQRGYLDQHLADVRHVYARRQAAMLGALERELPPGSSWSEPGGGMFMWVRLPGQVDTSELLPRAVERRVAFIPGSAFTGDGQARGCMRLNFATMPEAKIEEGMRRLGELVREV